MSRLAAASYAFALLLAGLAPAYAADLGYAEPAPADKWQFSLTPYAWAININGNVTARGHTADVNDDFFEIVDKSDSILAWMSFFEARKGRFSFFTDLVWADLGFPGHFNITTSPLGRFDRATLNVKGNVRSITNRPSSNPASSMKSRAGRACRAAIPPWT